MHKHNRDRRRMMALIRLVRLWHFELTGDPYMAYIPVRVGWEIEVLTTRLPPEMFAWVKLNINI